jgi:hypothetical protein
LRCIIGAGGVTDAELPPFELAIGFSAIHRAQAGLVADMDYVADVLYGRAKKPAVEEVAEVALQR